MVEQSVTQNRHEPPVRTGHVRVSKKESHVVRSGEVANDVTAASDVTGRKSVAPRIKRQAFNERSKNKRDARQDLIPKRNAQDRKDQKQIYPQQGNFISPTLRENNL